MSVRVGGMSARLVGGCFVLSVMFLRMRLCIIVRGVRVGRGSW